MCVCVVYDNWLMSLLLTQKKKIIKEQIIEQVTKWIEREREIK